MRVRGAVPPGDGRYGEDVTMDMISGGYFAAMGIPVLAGRAFQDEDGGGRRVVVLSKAAAKRVFGKADPLGREVQLSVGWGPETDWAEVIGIVGDVTGSDFAAGPLPLVYLDYRQFSYSSTYVVVRSDHPETLVRPLQGLTGPLDPTVPVFDVRTMEQQLNGVVARSRLATALLAVLTGLAMVLSLVGVYSVMSLLVRSRRRELSIRLAVGADRAALAWLITREGLTIAAFGLLLGLAAARPFGESVGPGAVRHRGVRAGRLRGRVPGPAGVSRDGVHPARAHGHPDRSRRDDAPRVGDYRVSARGLTAMIS